MKRVLLVTAGALLACACRHANRGSTAQPVVYARVAEAQSSEQKDGTITAGYRLFTAPDFETVCAEARAKEVARLSTVSQELEVRAGQPFALPNLRITAFSSPGIVLPKVPLAIEIGDPNAIFETQSDRIAQGSVTPIKPGRATFRARTICPGPESVTTVTVHVR